MYISSRAFPAGALPHHRRRLGETPTWRGGDGEAPIFRRPKGCPSFERRQNSVIFWRSILAWIPPMPLSRPQPLPDLFSAVPIRSSIVARHT
jgi:hypothetical protein